MTLVATHIDSPVGELRLVCSDAGLSAVIWQGDDPSRVAFAGAATDGDHPVLAKAARQISEYFAGQRVEFDLPLDLRGTAFQVKAWRALATIPFGQTVSYGEQAKRIGVPTAVRAIGAANGRNPVSIVLPCHRVIGADGSLTGFAGGLDAKRALLAFERRVADGDRTPMPVVERELALF